MLAASLWSSSSCGKSDRSLIYPLATLSLHRKVYGSTGNLKLLCERFIVVRLVHVHRTRALTTCSTGISLLGDRPVCGSSQLSYPTRARSDSRHSG